MGLFLLGEGVHVKFDKIRAKFYWEADAKKRKYHMIGWADLCHPKSHGGLGISNTGKNELIASYQMDLENCPERRWHVG